MAGRTPRRNERPDHDGTHRLAFERNKKKIYATQTVLRHLRQAGRFQL